MGGRAPPQAAPAARSVTFTFDTGMLIALERRKQRALQAFQAVVVASAALRGGGIVYTSDMHDLARFQHRFPAVRLLHV